MNTNQKDTSMENKKMMLSTLWTFATLNYLYADVIGLMNAKTLEAVLAGQFGSMQLTDGFFLGAAILMETSIMMVLLARILPYRLNRWTNIFSAILHTTAVSGSMFVGEGVEPYYLFFGTIEIICTLFIIWYAWMWRKAESSDVQALQQV